MKPRNFPGRKNRRRVLALQRLKQTVRYQSGNSSALLEAQNLDDAIVADSVARNTFTKKAR